MERRRSPSRALAPRWAALAAGGLACVPGSPGLPDGGPPDRVKPVDPPVQHGTLYRPALAQVDDLMRAGEARSRYAVNGHGLTAAVLDTGLRATHRDFLGRVLAGRNFTRDNGGNGSDTTDGHGHGSHVAGIIAASGTHTGIAPGASVVPLKVLANEGGGTFTAVVKALDWVLANRAALRITVVNVSLGDGGNYVDRGPDTLQARIAALREAGVAVVAAAGNEYYRKNSLQGMGIPAIFPATVSVGAVYSADIGRYWYSSGAYAVATGPDRLTPFSQRLHAAAHPVNRTDVFAPGAPVTSTGIESDTASATLHGTSQAAPAVAGMLLLLQEHHLRARGRLPTVDQLERWVRAGAVPVVDGDDEEDNCGNTGLAFPRADAVRAMEAMEAELRGRFSIRGAVRKGGAPLAGVRIAAGSRAATTSADGAFSLSNLPSGGYTVTPSKPGFRFEPSFRNVTLGPDAAGVEFNAAAVPTLEAITLSAPAARGGTSLSGSVTLSGPAAGASPVPVTSSHPEVAAVRRPAQVPAGGRGAGFTVSLARVRAPVRVTLRAGAGGVTREAVLTVNP